MHHGREFRNALLSLVSVFMGSKAGKELKKESKQIMDKSVAETLFDSCFYLKVF